jgi:cytochrome c oxidase subunit 2
LRGSFVLVLPLVAACVRDSNESAMNPAGPQAAKTASLWWFMLGVSAAVWLVVLAFLAYALTRGRRRAAPMLEPEGDVTMRRGVVAGFIATILILSTFLVYDIVNGRSLSELPRKNALRIEVVGHQWWWEVNYLDPVPGRRVSTANEIHIPVGEPVQLIGRSPDVIHSFWIPSLHGKKDLVPGHTTATWFQADKPGIYRGQCAEFCGAQHAKMVALVVAEPRAKFDAWYSSELASARQPSDSITARGETVFLKSACSVCHTISGTPAAGRIGPPLSHLASNLTIGAGSLRNTRGNLGGWIVDPQGIKPGTKMPPNNIDPADLQALLTYLQSLK